VSEAAEGAASKSPPALLEGKTIGSGEDTGGSPT